MGQNIHRFARLAQQQAVAHLNLPGQRGARDHDTGPGHTEGPVDGQAKSATLATRLQGVLRGEPALTPAQRRALLLPEAPPSGFPPR